MLIVQTADLKETPGAFIQSKGQNLLIINENESNEKIGKMIKNFTTKEERRKPVLAK